jgi:hypothetical protein
LWARRRRARCVAPILHVEGLPRPLTGIQVYFGSNSSQPLDDGGLASLRTARSRVANPRAPDRDPPADPFVGQFDTGS